MSVNDNVMQKLNPAAKGRSGFSFYEKMAFLYFLNLIDWLCTEALLLSGRFIEANPIMRTVLGGFWQTFLFKVALPLALVLVCCLIYKISGGVESRVANALIYIGTALYALVILWHIFNFVLLFSSF